MRSYLLDTDRLVNMLVPHYMGGRRLILYLQSCLKPLDTLNRLWKERADEMRIEAATTSQVILLEYYLNRKFGKYFLHSEERIVVSDGISRGIPLYVQSAGEKLHEFPLYKQGEAPVHSHETPPMHWEDERTQMGDVSFVVSCPTVNTEQISQEELAAMISYHVNRYRISGKRFIVTFNK